MKKKLSILFMVLMLMLVPILVACGGGETVVVSVNPSAPIIVVGHATAGSRAITATVTGSDNTAVTWTVPAGQSHISYNIAGNTITVTAVAAGAAGADATARVRATSVADPTQYAESVITVRSEGGDPGPGNGPGNGDPTITVADQQYAVIYVGFPNGWHGFTATVTGHANTAVTWTIQSGGEFFSLTDPSPESPNSRTVQGNFVGTGVLRVSAVADGTLYVDLPITVVSEARNPSVSLGFEEYATITPAEMFRGFPPGTPAITWERVTGTDQIATYEITDGNLVVTAGSAVGTATFTATMGSTVSTVTVQVANWTNVNSVSQFNNRTVSGFYRLTQDIDFEGDAVASREAFRTNLMTGRFDGQGFAIRNINMDFSAEAGFGYQGNPGVTHRVSLFGSIGAGAVVENVAIIGGTIHSWARSQMGIVASDVAGTIRNIYIEEVVIGGARTDGWDMWTGSGVIAHNTTPTGRIYNIVMRDVAPAFSPVWDPTTAVIAHNAGHLANIFFNTNEGTWPTLNVVQELGGTGYTVEAAPASVHRFANATLGSQTWEGLDSSVWNITTGEWPTLIRNS